MILSKQTLFVLGLSFLFSACETHTIRKQGYEVHGIDVSHYQKSIDWARIAEQNIHFAFIKATEGETFRDSLFCRNWGAIRKAGIIRGAYHFFRPTLSAEKQAQNFIDCVRIEPGDLAPVLDVEVLDESSIDNLISGLSTWLKIVEEKYQTKPIIYTNQNFFNDHLAGHFTEYPVWIARYSNWRYPAMLTEQEWVFWQYGNKGKLNGITGFVDFNVFVGNHSELEAFTIPPSSIEGEINIAIQPTGCVGP